MSERIFPRTFVAQRDEDVSGISGEGIVAEGVQFSDGWVVTHWLDKPPMHEPKTDVWHNPGVKPFERVHGHDGATRVVWADELAEQRAQMATLIVDAFDVPAKILGTEAERAVLYRDIAAALGGVWQAGRGPYLTQTDCGKYADAVMPVVEELLEQRNQARYAATSGMYDVLAVDIARAVNSTTEPEPGQDGHITDRRSGTALYALLKRAAGEAS